MPPLVAKLDCVDNASMPTLADKAATGKTAVSQSSRRLFLMVSGLGILVLVLFVMLAFGQIYGLEFSPLTFRRRSYMFFRVPVLGVQVTPVWRDDGTGELERYLKRQNLLPHSQPPDRWDVVWVTQPGGRREGDATILIRYLDMAAPEQDQHWYSWSQQHPQLAQVLWPIVQETALLRAYVLIPGLFAVAESTSDPNQFRHQLEAYLQPALVELANDQSDAGHPELARPLLEAILSRAELDPQWRHEVEQRLQNLAD